VAGRRLLVQLNGLALFAGHFPRGATVAVDLEEPSPVALKGRVGGVDRVVDGVSIHRFVLERLDQRHDLPRSTTVPAVDLLQGNLPSLQPCQGAKPAGGGALSARP